METPVVTPTSPATTAPGVTLRIAALYLRFDESALSASAGRDITVQFSNCENGTPHNVHFFVGPDASGRSLAASAIEPGPVEQKIPLGALPAGLYYFKCDVHATMDGTLTVG